ncbi:unnamed protein product [Callosobruchus maculatus]|uniref:Uncharacterized protein n=1 Tax=Callosobruchus maculatus TaxID=64391 RepID=A0A653BRN7_CALMS|nr:unnamed protein product [Callosobruchus maculatus]
MYHKESHSTKDEDSIKLYCESQSNFPVNDETIGIVSPKQIEATRTAEEEKSKCKVVNEIAIDDEPTIKINLLSKKRQGKTTSINKTDECEAVKSRNNEKKLSKHEESHSTKDEDSIELYCESQSDFTVNDETIGIVSPRRIEATVTPEEEKNRCKVVNEIVIDDEPTIKINLLSRNRHGKTTSITTDKCESIKSSNNEKKLPKHEESHSIKDEDSIKLYSESQSDFPVNDKTVGIVSPKQIEATGTVEERKNKCNVVNEIVINDEPAIKINLLSKKRQGKTTSITKSDKCETVKSRNNEKKLPKLEEKMFDDKNETHCKADCSTKGQDSFKSYYESICGVQVRRAKIAANFHLSEVESSQETVEKHHISPKPTDNLIKKSCDDLDIAENDETMEINSERKIEVTGSFKEGTNSCKSINEDNGFLQILIDEEPTIKINLLPKRKHNKTKSYPEAEKSLENVKHLLDNQLGYDVKNDSHWEDSDSTKDQDSFTCLHDIAGVTKSGNVEEPGLQEAQYNKEVFEKPLALQAAANLFQKSFDISDLTENNEEDIEATIKNELKRVNESNSTLQMVVIYDEPKTKDNLLSKSNKKPLNHFENSKTACKTVDETEDFISSKSFVEDHSKSLLDTFLNLETQYKKLNSILPEVSGDCKDNFEPVTNLVSETLANNIETDEDSEATTDKNDQMETTVNDRHELVQEINDPCDTKEDILARDTDFEKHCDQVDSNDTQTVFSKDEGLEEVECFETVNDGINENTESGALLEGNGTVLVYPMEKSYTTVVKRKICYELDEENIQIKDHHHMIQSACGELESVELEMPEITEILGQAEDKKKIGSLIESEVSSKIIVINEEPKIKINFLSKVKKKSQLTLCHEITNERTLNNVANSKNEEPIEESVGDKQITKCSEQYLGQKCPTNSVENKGEGKLGCQTDTIVINEEPKIKINFLAKRKKK